MTPSDFPVTDSGHLFQSWLALEPYEQHMLLLLAVIYKPISVTKFNQVVKITTQYGFIDLPVSQQKLSPAVRDRLSDESLIAHSKEGLRINPAVANRLVEVAIQQEMFVEFLNIAEQVVPVVHAYSWQNSAMDKTRLLRDHYFLSELENFESLLELPKDPQLVDTENHQVLIGLFFMPFDLGAFLKLSDRIQYQSFATYLQSHFASGFNKSLVVSQLKQVIERNPSNDLLKMLLAEQSLLSLDFDQFTESFPDNSQTTYALQLLGSFHFLSGRNDEALMLFTDALKAKNKITRRKKQYLFGPLGWFYKLCLMAQGSQTGVADYQRALEQIDFESDDKRLNSDWSSVSKSLETGLVSLINGKPMFYALERFGHLFNHSVSIYYVCLLNLYLSKVWLNKSLDEDELRQLGRVQAHFNEQGAPLFSAICEQLQSDSNVQAIGSQAIIHFPSLVKAKAHWQLALEKLAALAPSSNKESISHHNENASRLIWQMETGRYNTLLKPREQKLGPKGWSKGRAVALKRLAREIDSFDYLTEQDIKICQHIQEYQSWGYRNSTEYELEGAAPLQAAVGADNIYLAHDLSAPVELVQTEPELLVSQQGKQICLSLAYLPIGEEYQQTPYSVVEKAPGQYNLTVFSAAHMQVADIIGEDGLLIPIEAKKDVLKGIAAIAPLLNIQSDMAELETGLETRECDPNLIINIQPLQQGLQFDCVVMPFGEEGPALKPAIGNPNITTQLNGERVATMRNLLNEQQLLDQLDQHCPPFLAMSDNVLLLDDGESALNALEQLEQIVSQSPSVMPIKLRWPKGKQIKLTKPLTSEQMQLAVNKTNEWFELTGELKVDDGQVIELRRLLSLVASSNGRFITLDNEQILSLSTDLRNKLELLDQTMDQDKFHPLASLLVEEAATGMRLKTIHAWDKQTKMMREANLIEPKLPVTLQAQLRDYQFAGFDWATRLAHWGAGACLADDMGLGKTLQALAILLSRAPNGPSLVIAPTSVCFNWLQEALKFAPTLNMKLFADATNNEQRNHLLQSLGAFDCVVISYGLLQRETDLLNQIRWHTIVADEAQALKNPLAKRTKAAFNLKGDFKLITTGTPIENDLTELWSLFRFINPGLLGNLKQFGRRFIAPIANAKDDKIAAHKASQGLKTMIQPFILRRMKNQVLTELPPRTDINVPVTLSDEEQSFYEALRLNAIDNISAASTTVNAGEQRIKMLAELVKLRQACCHPALIMAESTIPSSKLAALDELLLELQQNNHKALIFSQFVGHLQLIKQHLEQKQISYQYLDGSTPQKDRQHRVNAFQRGEGDVFLISLKAGGSGLNPVY